MTDPRHAKRPAPDTSAGKGGPHGEAHGYGPNDFKADSTGGRAPWSRDAEEAAWRRACTLGHYLHEGIWYVDLLPMVAQLALLGLHILLTPHDPWRDENGRRNFKMPAALRTMGDPWVAALDGEAGRKVKGWHVHASDLMERVRWRVSRYREMFGADPNLAIWIGGSRLVVVDADTPEQVEAFLAAFGHLMGRNTNPTVVSPGALDADGTWRHHGGGHWWFTVPEGVDLSWLPHTVKLTGGYEVKVSKCITLIPPSKRDEGRYEPVGPVRGLYRELYEAILASDGGVRAAERLNRTSGGKRRERKVNVAAPASGGSAVVNPPIDIAAVAALADDLLAEGPTPVDHFAMPGRETATWRAAETVWEHTVDPLAIVGRDFSVLGEGCACGGFDLVTPGPHSNPGRNAVVHQACEAYPNGDGLGGTFVHVWSAGEIEPLARRMQDAPAGGLTLSLLDLHALLRHGGNKVAANRAVGITDAVKAAEVARLSTPLSTPKAGATDSNR